MKRRRTVNSAAARSAGSSTDCAATAHSLAQSLWTSQQQREIQLQVERTHTNSGPLSFWKVVLCSYHCNKSVSDHFPQP